MDRALLAIASSFALVLLATLVGYYEGEGWATISEMITRSPRLRNAFALFIGLMGIAQYYYCEEMLQRWERYGWSLRVEKVIVWLAMTVSFAGAVGFAIVSTDDNETQHLYFAAVSFAGAWVYIAVLYWMAYQAPLKARASMGGAMAPVEPSMPVATACMVLLNASGVALMFQPSWMQYAEYTFVASLHLAAACLCMPEEPPDMRPSTLLLQMPVAPVVVSMPTSIDVTCIDGTRARLQWIDPALQWLVQSKTQQFNVQVSNIMEFNYDRGRNLLEIRGQNRTATAQLNGTDVGEVYKLATYFNVHFHSN